MSHDYADPQFIAEPAIAALINGILSQLRLLCYITCASKALHKEATYLSTCCSCDFPEKRHRQAQHKAGEVSCLKEEIPIFLPRCLSHHNAGQEKCIPSMLVSIS